MKIKKLRFITIIIVTLFIGTSAFLTSCGGSDANEESELPDNNDVNEATESTEETDDEDDILDEFSEYVDDELFERALSGEGITRKGWPEGDIPSEVPEYEMGEVVNSGGTEEDFTILVGETSREDLDEYLDTLESSGWYVERDDKYPIARNNNISLHFQFNAKALLQISVIVQSLGSWPTDELPTDVLPPDSGTLIGEIYLIDNGDDYSEAYYFSYEYSDLTEEDIEKYMQKLIDNGWEGDSYMVTKLIEWKGKQFDASIEPYEDEGYISFTCNLWEHH